MHYSFLFLGAGQGFSTKLIELLDGVVLSCKADKQSPNHMKKITLFLCEIAQFHLEMGELSMSVKQQEMLSEVLHFIVRNGLVPHFSFGPVVSLQQYHKMKMSHECSFKQLYFITR